MNAFQRHMLTYLGNLDASSAILQYDHEQEYWSGKGNALWIQVYTLLFPQDASREVQDVEAHDARSRDRRKDGNNPRCFHHCRNGGDSVFRYWQPSCNNPVCPDIPRLV